VGKGAVLPGIPNHALKHISDDNKEVRRQWIPLPKTISTTDPASRDTIEEDRRMPSGKNLAHPLAPPIIKTSSFEDGNQTGPIDRVKCLPEIDLEDQGGGFARVAATKKVGCVHNVFRDAAAGEEASLVIVD
jgi:hypothetical protein